MRAALAQRVYEINRGKVKPLQILKDKNKRLDARAGERPSDHRRQLLAVNLIGWTVRQAFGRHRNVDQRREQGRMLRRVELDLREDRLQLGQPPLRRNFGTAEPSASPFEGRMQRRVL